MTNVIERPARGAGFDYAALEIPSELVAELEKAAANILSLGRKSTEQVFIVGALLEKASELVPEGRFGDWVKQRCGVEPKTARNYRAIHRNLAPHKDRILDLGISPTVLIHLSSASEEKIEEAFAFAEQNGGIQVDEVKTLLRGEATSEAKVDAEPTDVGGVDGLKALIALKTKIGLGSFLKHVKAIEKILGDALVAKGEGKRLAKGKLCDDVEATARLARHEIESLILFVQPNSHDPRIIHEAGLPGWSHWAEVLRVLHDLGGRESWPEARELEAWLSGRVLPLLTWATARTRLPDWPLAGKPSTPAPLAAKSGDGIVVDLVEAPSIDPIEELQTEDDGCDDAVDTETRSELPSSNVVPLGKGKGKGFRPNFLPAKSPEPVVD